MYYHAEGHVLQPRVTSGVLNETTNASTMKILSFNHELSMVDSNNDGRHRDEDLILPPRVASSEL